MSWVKFDDRFDDHEKVVELLGAAPSIDVSRLVDEDVQALAALAAIGLHMLALTNCGRKLTNGHVGRGLPRRFAAPEIVTQQLVDHEFWTVEEKGWEIHDYLDYNPSRDEVEARKSEVSEVRSEAGKRGAEARWHGKNMANGKQSDSPEPEPVPGVKDETPPRRAATSVAASVRELELLRWHAQLWGAEKVADSRWGKTQIASARWLLKNVESEVLAAVLRWAKSHTFWAGRASKINTVRHEWTALKGQYDAATAGGRTPGRSAAAANAAALQAARDPE